MASSGTADVSTGSPEATQASTKKRRKKRKKSRALSEQDGGNEGGAGETQSQAGEAKESSVAGHQSGEGEEGETAEGHAQTSGSSEGQGQQVKSSSEQESHGGKTTASDDKTNRKEYKQELMTEKMLDYTKERFPDLRSASYFVPSQQFYRTSSTVEAEHNVEVQKETASSDLGSDRAENVLTNCLCYIDKNRPGPMFVLRNYSFENYLSVRRPAQRVQDNVSEKRDFEDSLKMSKKRSEEGCGQEQGQPRGLGDPAASPQQPTCTGGSKQNRRSSRHKPHPQPTPEPVQAADDTKHESEQTSKSRQDKDSTQISRRRSSAKSCKGHSLKAKTDFKEQNPVAKDWFNTLESLDTEYRRGDFDALIVSPDLGLIVIEIKATGYNDDGNRSPPSKTQETEDKENRKDEEKDRDNGEDEKDEEYRKDKKEEVQENLKKKICRAFFQLNKSEYVLQHWFSDLLEDVVVTKALVLPNMSRCLVRSMVEARPDMAKELCECFKTTSVDLALKRILCADDLTDLPEPDSLLDSDSENVHPHRVLDWWANLTTGTDTSDTDSAGSKDAKQEKLSRDVYEKIISRLVGPYSKVTIEHRRRAAEARTAADCIHLTGLRFGRHILRPYQKDVLAGEEPFVFLTGPPGAGKTLVLGLKAEEWAKKGYFVVFVFSQGVVWGSLASWTLHKQVLNALKIGQTKTKAKDGNKPGKHKKAGNAVKPGTEDSSKPDDTMANPESFKAENADGVTENEDPAQNLHYVTISADDDPEQIVQDLMSKSKGRPVRLIVDECPSKRCPENIHTKLSVAQKSLETLKKSFEELWVSENGESRKTTVDSTPDFKHTDDEGFDTVKTSFEKTGRFLKNIQTRLSLFQPASGRPLVTQSGEWKSYMTSIGEISHEVEQQLQEIKIHIVDRKQCSEKMAAVLEQCAASTQEADGILDNTETALGYFVLVDLFQAVRARHADGTNISIWSSGVFGSYRPEGFVQKVMTHCIRCPPTVQRVLQYTQEDIMRMLQKQVPDMDHHTYSYQTSSTKDTSYPLFTDGPKVQRFTHGGHVTKVKDISDCRECGETLADYLQRTLRDGYDSGLRVEDVVISGNIHVGSNKGCAFTQALRERGLGLEYESFDLTLPPPYPGKIFIIGGATLQGLESKIVVFLPEVTRIIQHEDDSREFPPHLPSWLRKLGHWNRCHLWFVASRCLSQLVVFHV